MSIKDYSSAKEEEQMQKGEIDPAELLKKIIPDANERKNYKIERGYSGSAVDAAKKKYKNISIFQYELYHKENGEWKKIKWDKSKFFDNKGLNNYAIYGENGIVIIKPYSLAKAKDIPNVSASSELLSDPTNNESFSGGDYPLTDDSGFGTSFWMDVKGYSGDDEKILKNISFIKLCLIKECYETTGILL